MNEIESRLAEVMAARAREVEPHDEDDALNRISERVNMNRRRNLTLLGVAAAIAVVVGAIVLLNRDDGRTQQVNVATDSSDSSPSTTTSKSPVTVIATFSPAIWPFKSMNRTFATPEEAAKSFAVDYLGMSHARTGGTLPPADAGGATSVEVFPNDRGNARTLVSVEERPQEGWVVLGAAADQIVVDDPKPHDALTLPLSLSGRSVAFEAQLGVELRAFGTMTPFAQGSVMGGSSEMQPFQGQIDAPNVSLVSDQAVLILFEGDASGEQTYTKATVVPLDGPQSPATFVGTTMNGDVLLFDLAGGPGRPITGDVTIPTTPAELPSSVSGTLATLRGRFATIAFFDGTHIASYNPANGSVVQLVVPAAKPISLDADASGRHLLWVDENHDLWKWSGGDPVKVGSGFTAAAW
jgi:hypothetical protein